MTKNKFYSFVSNPFFVLFIISFVLHLFMRTNFGDDSNYFLPALEKSTYIEFLTMRYESWSSRVIIEGVLVWLVAFPWLWKILDSLVLVLIAWTISYLLDCQQKIKENWFISCLVLLYPISDMSSAGWMATTLNYLWVAAFMLFALTGAYNIFHQKPISFWHKVAMILATVYASNQEQACACMCLLFAVFSFYSLLPRFSHVIGRFILFIQLAICIGNFIFIILSPGNAWRAKSEQFTFLRSVNHGRYTVLEKFTLGFQNSMMTIFNATDMILFLFLAILFITVLFEWKKPLIWKCIFAIPLMINLLHLSGMKGFGKLTAETESLLLINNDNYMRKGPYIIIIFWAVLLLILVLSLLIISRDLTEFLYMLLIMGTGLGSSMIMGFSPTYDYSGKRTFIFFYFALIYMSAYIVLKHWKLPQIESSWNSKILGKGSELVLGMLTVLFWLNQWMYVCML